jgi:putative membrane protein
LIPVLISAPFSGLLKDAIVNEFVFGAFLAWGFELIIICGAFLKSIVQSLVISAVHPIPLLLVALVSLNRVHFSIPFSGIAVLAISLIFLLMINRVKTSNGVSSLQVLRAFLKTWVERDPVDLEAYFSAYAKEDSIWTEALIADDGGKRRAIIVVPGIHPGPFAPVGSYNVSELLHHELERSPNTTPVVLHGTGGHERNAPNNQVAREYAAAVLRSVEAQGGEEQLQMKGPLRSKLGITNITTLAFGSQVLAVVSNSPYRSDDLDPSTLEEAFGAAEDLGLKITIVDAHNSVDGKVGPEQKITKEQWAGILDHTLQLEETTFKIGMATSSEIGFEHQSDISDGGISVIMIAADKGDQRYVLVSADSNNAKSGLRESIETELNKLGVKLIDLCTSDTHKLAARNLTDRGYFALGEQTSAQSVIECIINLTVISEARLNKGSLRFVGFQSKIPLIGARSLDDFAYLTGRTISMTKVYTKVSVPVVLVLLVITLFY